MRTAIILRQDKTNRKGVLPVCMRIIHDRRSMYVTLIRVKPENWDSVHEIVKKSDLQHERLNTELRRKIAEVNKVITLCEAMEPERGIDAVRDRLHKRTTADMFAYAQNYLFNKEKSSVRTYNKCRSHIDKFKKFIGKESFSVSALTYELLLQYEKYLRDELENSVNTITTNMKTLKQLISEMYEEFRLDIRNNPFRKYKMKSTLTERPALSEREYYRVRNLKLIAQGKLYDARQIFVFEAETGIRISDILKLRWKNYDGNHIRIVMDKTDRPLIVPVSDIVKEICVMRKRRYATAGVPVTPDGFIFRGILPYEYDNMTRVEKVCAENSATARINLALKKVAILANVKKNLSTHIGRHTFASRLLRLDQNMAVIRDLLGHTSVRTTEIYAKVMGSQMDDAIDELNALNNHGRKRAE
ncbi:tyrosine-type recombinase/integrase [Alistipes sp.]|uniref:tyrosine-type recombinase/integrase n=1 Tax=Alistipes sp. TaxID=1872444 RepID=UPI003AB11649